MNKIFKIFALFILIAITFVSCSPENYSLGEIDVKSEDLVEGIAFKIEHDATNPNIIYLTSLMGNGYTPLWNHPQGRSQKQRVKLEIPFAGTYEVQFGVETRGGVVYGEKTTFDVKDMYAGFISDPLWTMISGGVGKEKTWYLDLDKDGVSRYFAGPLYFYGTADSWETVTNGVKLPEGSDSWSWAPDWKGNSWLMAAADFGEMTFNLKDGANLKVVHNTISKRGTETGMYMLSAEEHTMRTTDATILHDSNRDGVVIDWGNIKILSLTENTMQLGVLRDPALSGEGAALLVYNYISKDYRDNWTPGDVEPPYNGNANEDLTTINTKKWQMSTTTPYNWANLDGSLMNSWTSPLDYIGAGYAYNQSMIQNISLSMTKTGTSTGTYIFTDGSGNEITGSYKVDDKNNIIYDKDISFTISGSISLATTTDKALRLISTETDNLGDLSGIWLGQRNAAKSEYMVYHFELATSGSSEDQLKKAIIKALCGTSSKSFKISDSWHVDWCKADYTGGWTTESTFVDDYTSNSWVWTQAVKNSILDPRLTFSVSGNVVTCTKVQNGLTASAPVTIDSENMTLTIDMDLIKFGDAAAWLPSYGPTWKICKTNITEFDTKGMWLGIPNPDNETETIVIHYVVAN